MYAFRQMAADTRRWLVFAMVANLRSRRHGRAAGAQRRTAMLKSLALAAVLIAAAAAAVAHESEPQVDPDPALAAMRYCQTLGIRAAWGAQARFLGAPAQFKYIAQAPLKRMFMGETSEIPHDAIYVLDEMDLQQRQQYEEAAFYGWKQADAWMRDGRERPEYETLAAVFYNGCKQSLSTETQPPPSAALGQPASPEM
jgi:hypothetical protein